MSGAIAPRVASGVSQVTMMSVPAGKSRLDLGVETVCETCRNLMPVAWVASANAALTSAVAPEPAPSGLIR